MRCPVCCEQMIVMELNGVEIDHCLACKGVWLDSGELEILTGPGGKDDFPGTSDIVSPRETGEKPRRCPVCRKRMEKIRSSGEQNVILDRCLRGHGLWFDRGELEETVFLSANGKKNEVLGFLKNIFGKT